jgi:predicted metal-dependent hydrolase
MSESDGAFLLGVEQFNRGEFFAAHETWETIWLAAAGRDKIFLQGTIQLAAAFHHGKSANTRGMPALLRRALEKLAGFPDGYRGIRVDHLRQEAEGWIKALAGDLPLPDSPLKIEFANSLPGENAGEELRR